MIMLNHNIPGALSSQELREAIKAGWFGMEHNAQVEKLIQPASFDPILTEDCYLVSSKWKPDEDATILESLRRLPPRQRRGIDLTSGGLIIPNPDVAWLVFLEGTYTLPENFWLRSSPKSTEGRLGNWVQLVADRQTTYDEVDGPYRGKLAVKIDPRVFPSIIYPGMSVNQLRFFCGQDFAYDEQTLRRYLFQQELLYCDGEPIDADRAKTRKGLEIHLDLKGAETNGLIGFRAVTNPEPIDRRKRRTYPIYDYFDAIEAPATGRLRILEQDRLLILATHERVRIPRDMAAEMDAIVLEHGGVKWHEAGFFDPGFGYGEHGEKKGKSGVVEVHALGRGGEELKHRQGCGRLQYHPTRKIPDKWYGMDGLGSSYADQVGAWFANPFELPGADLGELARILFKQKEPIMAVANEKIFGTSDYFQGFATKSSAPFEERILKHAELLPREDVEHDTLRKQPIPYMLIINPNSKKFLVYERALEDEAYSERRLHGKISVGVGGHIRRRDLNGKNPLEKGRVRELDEEVHINGNVTNTECIGYINYDGDNVSKVHFGLLYIIEVDTDDVRLKDAELRSGRMMQIDEFNQMANSGKYEVEAWSRIAAEQAERFLQD